MFYYIADVDECLKVPCLHDGVCNNLDGSYNCSCQEGWSGDNCQTGSQIPPSYHDICTIILFAYQMIIRIDVFEQHYQVQTCYHY